MEKPRVFKSTVTSMWIAKVYPSPYSLTPAYLEYSHFRDAINTATSPRFQEVFKQRVGK